MLNYHKNKLRYIKIVIQDDMTCQVTFYRWYWDIWRDPCKLQHTYITTHLNWILWHAQIRPNNFSMYNPDTAQQENAFYYQP